MQDNDNSGYFLRTFTTTTVRPPHRQDEIELDDQAPLALVICIALPVFIGFVILVLIYCFCRRKQPSGSNSTQNATGNSTVYHRAPENDAMGMVGGNGGGSYPMTIVPTPYPGGFHPGPGGHMVHPPPPTSQGYRMIPQAMGPSPLPSYPNQQVPVPPPPHFGGVPAAYPPPHPYPHPVFLPPPSHPHTHSLSHSSQASSASATTVDPLVPSSPPQQHHHLMQQQLQHQQYLQQQQFLHHHQQQQLQQQMQMQSGRDSPAGLHHLPSQPSSSPLVQSGDPKYITTTAQPDPAMLTSVTSSMDGTESVKATTPLTDSHQSPTFLRQPQSPEQDLGYSDEEE